MEPVEPQYCSFILKVWLEEPDEQDDVPAWRGQIAQVPGDARRYVKSLGEVVAFIENQLRTMGARMRQSE
jgi:hypothetical protein